MKHCRNKVYGFILTHIGVVFSEIQPNKVEVTKGLKRCVGGTTFVDV